MDSDDGDGGDSSDHRGEHDEDEPGRTVCGLRRGLRNSHGVDEGVRDEQDELHGSSMLERSNSSRKHWALYVVESFESKGLRHTSTK